MPGPEESHDSAWRRQMAPLADEAPADPAAEARTVDALRLQGHFKGKGVVRKGFLLAAAVILLVAGAWLGRQLAPEPADATGKKFALLLIEDSTYHGEADVGIDSIVSEYSAWAGTLRKSGQLVLGEALSANQLTLGPVTAETSREANQITGFFIITATDQDAAIALAKTCPHLRYGGGIVVRPIFETS